MQYNNPAMKCTTVEQEAVFLKQADQASYVLQACFLLTAGYSCLVVNLLAFALSCFGLGLSHNLTVSSLSLFSADSNQLKSEPAQHHQNKLDCA